MTNTTTPSASDSGLNLDHLEAVAGAADPTGAAHLVTHYRNSADTKAEEAFRRAATPAAVLELIALARRAAPVSAPIAGDALRDAIVAEVKVAIEDANTGADTYMAALIAAAKIAALANQSAPTAAPEQVDERARFEAWVNTLDIPRYALNRWPDGRYCNEPIADYWTGWQARAALSQPSEAAPLYADEMTRLRRLMKALGQEDAFERDDEYVRGTLCTVLGIAAGWIESAAPAPEVK